MKDLINCTYGYDEVMVASNIRTDEQLGQFIIENELHDDVNSIPESSLYLLDKVKLGVLYRESFNCTLTDGYAIFTSDYTPPEVYDGKQLPDTEIESWYAFRLHVAPAPAENISEVEDKALWITLPMEQKAIDRLAKELGVGNIEECVYLNFLSAVPQITAEQFGNMQDFDKLNDLAEQLPYALSQNRNEIRKNIGGRLRYSSTCWMSRTNMYDLSLIPSSRWWTEWSFGRTASLSSSSEME